MKLSSFALLSLALGSRISLVSGTVICDDTSPITGGVIHDDVQVPKDASCTISNGATIQGKLTLKQGSSTDINDGSTVTGDIKGEKIRQLTVFLATIGGNVKVADSPHTNTGALNIRVSDINGNVEIKDSGFGEIVLGSLQIGTESRSSKVVVEDNTVNGADLVVEEIAGASNVSKMTVKGNKVTSASGILSVQGTRVNDKIILEDNSVTQEMLVVSNCASNKIEVRDNVGVTRLNCNGNRENDPGCSGGFPDTIAARDNTFPWISGQCDVEALPPSPPSKSSKGGGSPPSSSKGGGSPPSNSKGDGGTSKGSKGGRQRNLRL